MGLFNIFQQKTVNILPGSSVTVEYLRTDFHNIVNSLPDGELILVKRHIQPSDAEAILDSQKSYMAVTTQPETIEEFDALNLLSRVGVQSGIALDFLYCGDELFVFSDEINEAVSLEQQRPIPNAIRIFPISRHDAEIVIAIDFDRLLQGQHDKEVLPSVLEAKGNNTLTPTSSAEVAEEEKQAQQEISLLRKELSEMFNEKFSIDNRMLYGISLESQTIALTDFYKRNGIAEQRLRGSWKILDKEQAAKLMDVGIGQRALTACRKEYTRTIEGYGRIVSKIRENEFSKAVEGIIADMKSYLTPGKKIEKVGTVPVKRVFSPDDLINDNLSKLQQYLSSLSPTDGISASEYSYNVQHFIEKVRTKSFDFPSKVRVEQRYITFLEQQWEEPKFIENLSMVCFADEAFFGDDFIQLLIRYKETLEKLEYYQNKLSPVKWTPVI